VNGPRRDSRRTIGAVIGILVIALLVVLLFSFLFYPPTLVNDGGPDHFPFWILGFLFVFIIVGFIIRVIFWALLGYPPRRYRWYGWDAGYGAPRRGRNAEDILDERYARGEITREQYQQMMEDLKRGRA
jgi:putative membrane protein